MKKALLLVILCVMVVGACTHSLAEKRGEKTMFYPYPFDEVFSAVKKVLKEQDYQITEINVQEKYIKAITSSDVPGLRISIVCSFRTEESGTWLGIEKKVPPQIVPGTKARYRMDVNELFRYVDLELERTH